MWNLYQDGKFLEPLKFSNGKNQNDVVEEILGLISGGKKIIFVHGECGTGKSAIALNLANRIGKTSVVVPNKNLQNQYKKDYGNEKYLLKKDGEKLKISIMTGRNNHKCKFLEDNEIAVPVFKREVNSKLNDIFEFSKKETEEKKKRDFSADNPSIPCKIEIKEKNFYKIREFLRKNKNVNMNGIGGIKDVKRIPLACVCPYWSPVLPEKYDENKNLENAEKRTYQGLNNVKFAIYKRKSGCDFYGQFNSYIDSDVIIFNSLKYKLESALNRKPLTEIEVIDECDEFLDSFSNQRTINFDRLQNSVMQAISTGFDNDKIAKELYEIVNDIKNDSGINDAVFSKKIIPLRETKVYDLFKIFLDSPGILEDIDDESYLFDVEGTVSLFEDFIDESYVTFSKNDKALVADIVTTNLAKKFKEMADKNKILVFMSGTLHSEKVLNDVFGISDFSVVNAETKPLGKIDVIKTGMEMDCKYENFSNGKQTREQYLKALDKCVEIAKKPALVHVNSFNDLPTEEEMKKFLTKNLLSVEKIKEMQDGDKDGKLIQEFKDGKINVLFTTRSSRGIDFPGEQCNSIIYTKYPYPNINDAFWKILKATKPNYYWDFYKDKARRELLQKVYRGLRFKGDHVFVLSPDKRVTEFFEARKN
ncbi:DUF2075 domain-containing protein [Candidatus Pacearchaeota archaeon]|nr:DUF2075 domain-containing protein [Candidatus Pacearchaeota archaeon]